MNRNAVIIALGQPSAPLPHDATMQALAEDVATFLPGWTVRGATLESHGSLVDAVSGLAEPLLYPLFMATGFFMAQVLPKRLAKAVPDAKILAPFGEDHAIPGLILDVLASAAAEHGFEPRATSILLAAHGSERYAASHNATEKLAEHVATAGGFRRVVTGYLEQKPYIEDSAQNLGQALCLPVFVLRASHVAVDIPRALKTAGFSGVTLPPLGMHPKVPPLIAAALRRQALPDVA